MKAGEEDSHADLHRVRRLDGRGRARAVRESPQRLDAAKRQPEDMGGHFVAFWMTLGEHGMVLVYETPDDAVAARFALVLNGLGSVRTKTMKAFPEAAYRGIMASLG